jgi:hypothetical protein
MGFLTNISISNDFWHTIKKDPEKLVDAIGVWMNHGSNSPVGEVLDAQRREREVNDPLEILERRARADWEQRRLLPQGVTVHHARHYDEPQVIVNAYGMHPVAANELPQAIRLGWLDLNEYKRKHAENVAKELERLAKEIRQSLKQADAASEAP